MRLHGMLAVAALAIGLAGCETAAENEGARLSSVLTKATQDFQACLRRAQALPANQTLASRVDVVTPAAPGMAQRMDERRLAAEDVANVLVVYQQGVEPCRKQVLMAVGTADPSLAAISAQTYTAADENLTRLLRREITIGQYSEAKDRIYRDNAVRWQQATSAIRSNLARSHEAEIAQRQRAAVALQQWTYQQQVLMQQQQVINAMNQPRYTNCQYVGAVLNCATF